MQHEALRTDIQSKTRLLIRWQKYVREYPFNAWLIHLAIGTPVVVSLAACLHLHPLALPAGTFAISTTIVFMHCISERQSGEESVSPQQINAIGISSLALGLLSIFSLLFVVFSKYLNMPKAIYMMMLPCFAFGGVLSLIVGYAVRQSKTGEFSLRLTASWMIGLLIVATLRLLLR